MAAGRDDASPVAASEPAAGRIFRPGSADSPLHELLGRPARAVAPRLLGWEVESTTGGVTTRGRIVEVEAYTGPRDDASHAAARIGRTRRNESMFGPPGTAYVYLIYGVHWCLNVVTDGVDFPAAVLLRALEPLEGHEVMRRRRGRETEACAGPGRLCEALGITGALDGHDLGRPPLRLVPRPSVPRSRIARSTRIGVSRAKDAELRFFVHESPWVSRSR